MWKQSILYTQKRGEFIWLLVKTKTYDSANNVPVRLLSHYQSIECISVKMSYTADDFTLTFYSNTQKEHTNAPTKERNLENETETEETTNGTYCFYSIHPFQNLIKCDFFYRSYSKDIHDTIIPCVIICVYTISMARLPFYSVNFAGWCILSGCESLHALNDHSEMRNGEMSLSSAAIY